MNFKFINTIFLAIVLFYSTTVKGEVLYLKPAISTVRLANVSNSVPLTVKVVNSNNKGIAGVKVSFSIELAPMEADGYEISSSSSITNKDGIAKVSFKTGNKAGTYRISAKNYSLLNSPIIFSIITQEQQITNKKVKVNYNKSSQYNLSSLPKIPLPTLPSQEIKKPIAKSIATKKSSAQKKVLPQVNQVNKKTNNKTNNKKKPLITIVKSINDLPKKNLKENNETKLESIPQEITKEPATKVDVVAIAENNLKGNNNFNIAQNNDSFSTKVKIKSVGGEAVSMVIAADPNICIADGKNKTIVKVKLWDKYGNPVADGTEVTVKTDVGTITANDVNSGKEGIQLLTYKGIAAFYVLSPQKAVTGKVYASYKNLQGSANINFVAGNLTILEVEPTKSEIKAGESIELSVRGFDKFHNEVNFLPQWFIEEKIGQVSIVSDRKIKFVGLKKGDYKIGVGLGEVISYAKVKINPANPAKLEVVALKNEVKAGDSVKIKTKVLDKYNNAVSGINLDFSSNNGGGISNANCVTNDNGACEVTFATSKKVGINTFVVKNEFLGEKQINIKGIVGEAAIIKAESSKYILQANGVDKAEVTAYISDKNGNVINKEIPINISLSKGSIIAAGKVLNKNTTLFTNKNGMLKFLIRAYTKSGSDKILLSYKGIQSSIDINFIPGEIYKITCIPEKKQLTVGKGTTKVNILAADKFNNLVSGDKYVNINLSGGSVDESAETNKTLQLVNGKSFLVVRAGEKVGILNIVAKTTDGKISSKTNIKLVADKVERIEVIPSDAKVVAGKEIIFKAKGYDFYGNVVEVNPVWVVSSIGKINVNTGRFIAQTVGDGQVVAKVGELQAEAKVVVSSGSPVKIQVKISNNTVVAGGTTVLTATVYDAFNNVVPNVVVLFKSKTPGVKFSENQAISDVHGKCTVEVTVPKKAGDINIEVTSPQILKQSKLNTKPVQLASAAYYDFLPIFYKHIFPSTNINIKVIPGDVEIINLVPSLNYVEANGSKLVNIKASALDANNNLVSNNLIFNFTVPPYIKVLTPDEDKNKKNIQVTAKNGVAILTIVAPTKASITEIKSFVLNKNNHKIEGNTKINFHAGVANKIIISATPEKVIADEKNTIKVNAKIVDAFFNPVEDGTVVTLKVSSGKFLNEDKFDMPGLQLITSGGEVEAQLQASKKAGEAVISVSAGKIFNELRVTYLTGNLEYILVFPVEVSITAGEKKEFKASGYDKNDNPVFIAPEWGVVGVGSINNKATFTSTKAGESTVVASYANIVGKSSIKVLPSKPSEITIWSQEATAKVGRKVLVFAKVKDIFGNVVPEEEVFFTVNTPSGIQNAGSSFTNSKGIAKINIKLSEKAGNNIIEAYCTDLNPVSFYIKAEADTPNTIVLTSSPNVFVPGKSNVISAKVVDKFGNLVKDGIEVSFTTTAGVFAPGSPLVISKTIGGIANAKLNVFDKTDKILITASVAGATSAELELIPGEITTAAKINDKNEVVKKMVGITEGRIIDDLVMSDAEIKSVLSLLSQKSGLNIIVDEKVKGKVNVELHNIYAEEALNLILESKGLTYKKMGNSYLVATKEKFPATEVTEILELKEADAKDIQKILKDLIKEGKVLIDVRTNSILVTANPNVVQQVVPIVEALDKPVPPSTKNAGGIKTEVFHLQHADGEKVMTILKEVKIGTEEGAAIQIYKGEVSLDKTPTTLNLAKGNTIIIKDTAFNIMKAKEIISQIDVAPKQVTIEVRIEEINSDAIKDLGFKFGGTYGTPGTYETSFIENTNAIIGGISTATTTTTTTGNTGIAGLGIRGFTRSALTINTTINALQEQGKAKTLASPSITAIDGTGATIFLGKKIPFFPKFIPVPGLISGQGGTIINTGGTGTGSTGTTSTTTTTGSIGGTTTGVNTQGQSGVFSGPYFIDAGITLDITPNIDNEGRIITLLKIDVSNLVSMIDDVPLTEQRKTETTISLKDGETLVIGGLISSEEVERQSKFPILADAPILGNLFKSKKTENKQTELVILLTPHIVSQ